MGGQGGAGQLHETSGSEAGGVLLGRVVQRKHGPMAHGVASGRRAARWKSYL